MAYTPSLNDISDLDTSSGYTPSINDVSDIPDSPSLLQQALQAGKDFIGGLAQNVLEPASAIQSLARSHPTLAGALLGGSTPIIANAPDVKSLPGISTLNNLGNPSDVAYEAGEWAPAALGGAKLAYGIGQLGLAGVSKLLSPFTQKAADDSATNFLSNVLLKGQDISDVHNTILDNIRDKYTALKNASSDNYNNLLDAARSDGYLDNAVNPVPGLGVPNANGKVINTDLFNPDAVNSKTNLLDSALQNFNDAPSFLNAHRLQSQLFKDGSQYASSLSPDDQAYGNTLLNQRSALNSDIRNTFANNGDNSLSDLYNGATDFHRQYVAPFVTDNTVRKIVTQDGLDEINPTNIHNILNSDNGSISAIRPLLSQDTNDLIYGKALAGAKKNGTITASNLLNKASALEDKGFNQFLSPDNENTLYNILNQSNAAQMRKRIGLLAGGALGANAGINKAKEFF
jgi:hypothetical protein